MINYQSGSDISRFLFMSHKFALVWRAGEYKDLVLCCKGTMTGVEWRVRVNEEEGGFLDFWVVLLECGALKSKLDGVGPVNNRLSTD